MRLPDFKKSAYHPVVKLGRDYQVLDFTVGPAAARTDATYSVGRYNEDRKNMYTAPLFEGQRTVHMGIDLGGPVGTPVHAFFDGTVHDLANHQADGDYGPTLITRHQLGDTILYALHGHLSAQSLDDKNAARSLSEANAWAGSEARKKTAVGRRTSTFNSVWWRRRIAITPGWSPPKTWNTP